MLGTLAPLDVGAEPPEPPRAAMRPEAPPVGPLRILVETPHDGALVASADPSVVVAGRVLLPNGKLDVFDLVIVIDRSKSTDAPTGVDIDGDGYVGRAPDSRYADGSSDDPGDSVLAAEIVAARTLIAQLDPATTRVALVSFSGDTDPETPDAHVLTPLSSDYLAAHRALDALLEEWPSGRTHLAAAIHTATAELMGIGFTSSEPRPEARKIILLMTDGQPTLPIPFSPKQNADATFLAARLAARGGIRIDAFAIGRDANENPDVTQGIAAITRGEFTGVVEPRDLVSTFERLRLASIEAFEVHNRTTQSEAEVVLLESDGHFAALVELAPGDNRLELRARGEGGRWTFRPLRVQLAPSEGLAKLHPRYLEHRTRLLEEKLSSLRRRQLSLEAREDVFGPSPAGPEGGDVSQTTEGRARPSERSLEIQVEEPELPAAVPAAPAP